MILRSGGGVGADVLDQADVLLRSAAVTTCSEASSERDSSKIAPSFSYLKPKGKKEIKKERRKERRKEKCKKEKKRKG